MSRITYQCVVSRSLDQEIQKAALRLAAEGQLKDDKNRPVEIRIGANGKRHLPRYSLTKIALVKFLDGNGRERLEPYETEPGSRRDC
jgi:hypothetical protein